MGNQLRRILVNNDSSIVTVCAGEPILDPLAKWDYSSSEQMINMKINQQNAKVDAKVAVQDNKLYQEEQQINLLRSELNAKQLEVGAVETDAVPTLDSSNFMTSGAIYNTLTIPELGFIDSVYDITARHNGDTYDDLADALNGGENVPETVRRPGMSVKFVRTSDNKYVQYRFLLSGSFTNEQFVNPDNWYNDYVNVSTDSQALNINDKIAGYVLVSESNPEYSMVMVDTDGKFIFGIKIDGSVEWAKGIPTPIQNELSVIATSLSGKANASEVNAALNGKVDKINGKGLSTNDFTDSDKSKVNIFEITDNPEYAKVIVDSNDKFILGIRKDGTVQFFSAVKFENSNIKVVKTEISELDVEQVNISDFIAIGKEEKSSTDNNEFVKALIDSEDKLIYAIYRNGNTYIGNITGEQSSFKKATSNEIDFKKANNQAVTAINNAVVFPIQSYYVSEFNRISQAVCNDFADYSLSYALITDVHYEGNTMEYMRRQCYAFASMLNHSSVDFGVIDGDLTYDNHNQFTKAQQIGFIHDIMNFVSESKKPIFIARGNHDFGWLNATQPYSADDIISANEWYGNCIAYFPWDRNAVHDTQNPNSTYFYYDFPNRKTRVIVIDTSDYKDYSECVTTANINISNRQAQWFVQEALNKSDAGWKIIVFGHCPINELYWGNGLFPSNANVIRNAITALNNRTTESAYNTDFSSYNSKVVAYHFGHCHADLLQMNITDNLCHICTRTGKMTSVPIQPASLDLNPLYYEVVGAGVLDTITECAFDVITINSTLLKAYRFGCGQDRNLVF